MQNPAKRLHLARRSGDRRKPAADLEGKDLQGKIAVVKRDVNYDRSVQLANLIAARAAGMLYVSQAPNNLRQVGTVRKTFEAMHAIPAVSIGKVDGEALGVALS